MQIPSPELLTAENEATAYLLLRWQEFFDPYTPDTFQPKVCNIPALVEEIEDVSGRAIEEELWGKHLVYLKEELNSRLKDELVRSFCSKQDLFYLERILKEERTTELNGLCHLLTTKGFRPRFENKVYVFARSEIPNLLPQKKGKTDKILCELAIISVNREISWTGFDIDTEKLALPIDKALELILSEIEKAPQSFTCVLEPTGDAKDINSLARRLGFRIISPRILRESPLAVDGSQRSFVAEEIIAHNAEVAFRHIRRRLSSAFDLLNFYEHQVVITVPNHGWIGPDEGNLTKISVAEGAYRKLHPRRRARRLAIHGIASNQNHGLESCIVNAVELYALAMKTDDPRLRLLNLWSALECLSSVVEGKTVITRVLNIALPILTWRRFEKLTRYLAINLHQWRQANGTTNVPVVGLPGAANPEAPDVPVEEVLLALTKPNQHQDIVSVIGVGSSHPLLRNRILTEWERFHSPASLAFDLSESEKRLRWHLWRIYRARNLLVHDGTERTLLPHLVDNLHFYFSMILSRLLHGLSINNKWTMSDIARHWQMKKEFVESALKSDPTSLTVGDLLTSPTQSARVQVWQNTVSPDASAANNQIIAEP